MAVVIDIVTVVHNDTALLQAEDVAGRVLKLHPHDTVNIFHVDNRVENRGFAKGCNVGAARGTAPIIGFLNPDVHVRGQFLAPVAHVLTGDVVITGCRFGKIQMELDIWGVSEWVCGAAMFVRRDFWEQARGFDEQFVWSHEETDLIRRAEAMGKVVKALPLAIDHSSPDRDTPADAAYKRYWFTECQRRYIKKWQRRG